MTKPEVRRWMRQRLSAMTSAERSVAGERIADRLWTLPEIASARTVLLYASLPDEVPTAPIAEEARRRGISVTYPRCLHATREMTLHRVGSASELIAGRYGILEPADRCEAVAVQDVDVALVPGLAWDRAGNRLGRGAGYYDRLFAHPEWRALRCGIFFALQEATALPTDPWDAPLNVIVTESETIRISPSDRRAGSRQRSTAG